MKLTTVAVLVNALLVTGPAFATTIVNKNAKDQTLTVDWGATQKEYKLTPGQILKVDCPDGCSFRLPDVGYGRQTDNAGQLVIATDGMLRFPSEKVGGPTAD